MALTDKLTAIANAIRGKTGGAAELTLSEMASEITDKLSGNSLSLTVIVAQTSTQELTVLEANSANAAVNSLLLAHRNDSTFAITFVALDAVPDASHGFRRFIYVSTAFSVLTVENNSEKTYSTASGTSVRVGDNGQVTVYANSGGRIGAGSYRLTFSW